MFLLLLLVPIDLLRSNCNVALSYSFQATVNKSRKIQEVLRKHSENTPYKKINKRNAGSNSELKNTKEKEAELE